MRPLSCRIAPQPTPVLHRVPVVPDDALAPARGICWGLVLSVGAWALIGVFL